jgi:hypothetical protein
MSERGDLGKWHLVPVATGKCCGCFACTRGFWEAKPPRQRAMQRRDERKKEACSFVNCMHLLLHSMMKSSAALVQHTRCQFWINLLWDDSTPDIGDVKGLTIEEFASLLIEDVQQLVYNVRQV